MEPASNARTFRRPHCERGYVFLTVPAAYDARARIEDLDKEGIDMQVMSLSEPWVDFLAPVEGKQLAQLVNDDMAQACERHSDRLAGLATIPLTDANLAVEELDRAIRGLGLKGIILPSRVSGDKPISARDYLPVFERIAALGVPVFIHPALPPGSEKLRQYRLALMTGYPLETTLVVTQLIFGGLFERYPSLKILLADLGGALPFLVGRMQRFYGRFEDCRVHLTHEPIEHLRKLYYENGSESYPQAMACTYALGGAEHMMLGTNHPAPIVDFKKPIDSVREMQISAEDRERIFSENARTLFRLDV